MNKHILTLLGGSADELRVPMDAFVEVLAILADGARQAARFAVEGESRRKGPRPTWLDAATRFDLVGLTAGSAVVAIEAPTLREADPSRFEPSAQRTLFEEQPADFVDRTAVELFAQVFASAVEGDSSRVLADRPLLETCVRLARAAGGRFAGVRLDGLRDRENALVIRPEHLPRLERLRDDTPDPQAVRVAGILDTISATRVDIVLRLPDGTKVPARMEAHDPAELRALFGQRVVVSGIAHYRPSGQLLFVAVEALDATDEADAIFERLPAARAGRRIAPLVAQDENTGVGAFFGIWPGDESDRDLLDALEAIE